MITHLNEPINRKNTSSEKWDSVDALFGGQNLLPMWVADMDFKAPAPVLEAMKARIDHGIIGYTSRTSSYYKAVSNWMKRRFNWTVEEDWICYSPGVVPALNYIVQSFTKPGDKVMIQTPVYPPFFNVVTNNDRELVPISLLIEDGQLCMDFDEIRKHISDGVKLFILCSPHNPGGRVWSKEELIELGELCLEYDVLVVSDEVHGDLVYKEYKHTPFAQISEAFAQNSIICTAPSKTFNLAGLHTSNIIIPNEKHRETFKNALANNFLDQSNTFGVIAVEHAYNYGEEWLEEVLAYCNENVEYLTNYIETHIPEIKVIKPEGTYLVWLDCRGLGMEEQEFQDKLIKEAKVAVNWGSNFGEDGAGFVRINIACPRSLLEEGLERIYQAFKRK